MGPDLGLKWNFDEFPVVFSGMLRAPGGRDLLVVAQLQHGFTGDGYWKPGPEIFVHLASIRLDNAGPPVLVAEGRGNLGAMQYSVLYAGKARPGGASFEMQVETGRDFDAPVVSSYKLPVCTLLEDGRFQFQR